MYGGPQNSILSSLPGYHYYLEQVLLVWRPPYMPSTLELECKKHVQKHVVVVHLEIYSIISFSLHYMYTSCETPLSHLFRKPSATLF